MSHPGHRVDQQREQCRPRSEARRVNFREQKWVNSGERQSVVALANKMARIGWAVIGHDEPYRPEKAFAAR